MSYLDNHWLKDYFKGWSDDALLVERDSLIIFGGPESAQKMVEAEIKRRGEEVA